VLIAFIPCLKFISMKKQLLLIITLLPFMANAQNVGIGTSTPSEKLEIKNPLRSTLKISAGSLADTTQLILSNSGSTAGFYTDFSIKSVKEEGLFFSSQSDFISYNSANSLVIRPQGNIGIGNSIPSYKLDVNGDINTTGKLRLNGNPGTAGQVLTSNGTADPTWESAAYSNNIRFSFNLTQMGAAASDSLNFNGTPPNYNLNPAMVSVVPGNNARIVINKSGLYHFSGSISMTTANISPEVSNGPTFSVGYWINNKSFSIESAPSIAIIGFVPDDDFTKTFQFSFDVYLTAGQTIKFTRFSFSFGGVQSTSGHVNGYLIND
jgi:hypothetical protein